MADPETMVIVGAGMAGAKAAEALRDNGFEGHVVLVGAEEEAPYERPPLSKGYLRGESPREKARVHEPGFYAEHDVELLTGVTAVGLDPVARRVDLGDHGVIGYDRLLLATGAVPRRPRIPGAAGLEHVHVLRTLADADALGEDLRAGGPLVVVGGGWIGCELAASARQMGVEVALVEQARSPLERVLGERIGGWFGELHRARGVDLHLGAGVHRIDGDSRVERVTLSDGRCLDAAIVVLGVGVVPDTRLAAAGGLTVEDGIATDALLRTSVPDVYAAGDVAGAFHPRYGRRVRVEHWSNALHQGTAAGASMLGRGTPYDRLPSFFSDQYDAGLEYVGLHDAADRLVIRGSLDSDRFQAFWLGSDGRVTAGMHVNDWDAIGPIRDLVERGEPVDAAALADLGTPYDQRPMEAAGPVGETSSG